MGFTTLPLSGLRQLSPVEGSTDWVVHFDYNMTRLNFTLLKLNALLDVDATGINDGDVLRYESASGKWKPFTPQVPPL